MVFSETYLCKILDCCFVTHRLFLPQKQGFNRWSSTFQDYKLLGPLLYISPLYWNVLKVYTHVLNLFMCGKSKLYIRKHHFYTYINMFRTNDSLNLVLRMRVISRRVSEYSSIKWQPFFVTYLFPISVYLRGIFRESQYAVHFRSCRLYSFLISSTFSDLNYS